MSRKNRSKESLSPFIDKLKETNRLFLVQEKDIDDLKNTRLTPLDSFFLEVAEKHGHDLSELDRCDPDGYLDEYDDDGCED